MKIKNSLCLLYCFILFSCSDNSTELIEPQLKEAIVKKIFTEDFEIPPFYEVPKWRIDTAKYDGPYSESGEYFQQQNIFPPLALRNTIDIGKDHWLIAELYTRTKDPIILDYLDIVPDPDDLANKVLKISTPDHSDGVILRSKEPLPKKYRITLKIGFAEYGNDTTLNGYSVGNERAEPWRDSPSVGHNGFYWLAILDRPPMPHNNIWLHHHRKFVIDSWNRKGFNHGVNVFALDGKSETHPEFGKKFISYVDDKFRKISDVPVDFYLPGQWYTVTFTRTALFYEFSIKGNFKNAGHRTYTDRINLRKQCVFHYNQTKEELAPSCVDNRVQRFLGKEVIAWPTESAYPEYFMLGEPHINYYEGNVLVDDITLEVL
jgi:hypothetical protein